VDYLANRAPLAVAADCGRSWCYIADLLAKARKGMPHISIPLSV
jgi:hypothetical protein